MNTETFLRKRATINPPTENEEHDKLVREIGEGINHLGIGRFDQVYYELKLGLRTLPQPDIAAYNSLDNHLALIEVKAPSSLKSERSVRSKATEQLLQSRSALRYMYGIECEIYCAIRNTSKDDAHAEIIEVFPERNLPFCKLRYDNYRGIPRYDSVFFYHQNS